MSAIGEVIEQLQQVADRLDEAHGATSEAVSRAETAHDMVVKLGAQDTAAGLSEGKDSVETIAAKIAGLKSAIEDEINFFTMVAEGT